MIYAVKKRNGSEEPFNIEKINLAIEKCLKSVRGTDSYIEDSKYLTKLVIKFIEDKYGTASIQVEVIQDIIENLMMSEGWYKEAKSFILYRNKHSELRLVKDRAKYIEEYSANKDNAATNSEVDANANVQNKNIATLNSELYKKFNIDLSRYRVTEKLKELYGSDCDYIKNLNNHIIYKHDEGSSAAIMPYCVAVSLYPFLLNGTSTLDGLKSEAPKHLESFAGQFNNLVFLLSSQFAGAVAFGEFFNVFNYYCIKDFGEKYYTREDDVVGILKQSKITIKDKIQQIFQNIVYTLNQSAGNRSFQSPFTNFSYFDSNYWKALFGDFCYPDGTKPEWKAIDYLQRLFIHWFNKERTKTLLTFPVESMCLLSNGKDIIDKDYKKLTSEMYSKGHSFFTYISDNPNSLSSCCRLRNEVEDNEFSFTNGLTGVMTGSKSVITINLNRFIQDLQYEYEFEKFTKEDKLQLQQSLKCLLDNIYKYHTAYNELLYDLYNNNMLPAYSAGYINLNKQFLTIGINGLNEAAEFLGIPCRNTENYKEFSNIILETIKISNTAHRTDKTKFNCEFVPAESLGIKNYNWDKEDGYWVPEDRNCYNSYFYKPDDPAVSVLEKFQLHGNTYTKNLDGGVGLHCNLQEHLTEEQYSKLLEVAVKEDCNYFTFNIPNSQCDECGYIEKRPLEKCPKCGSTHITQWTRIIGYLRAISNFSKGRQIEASKRIYNKNDKTN